MLRVKSIACAIAVLLSSSVSAFDIPLYKQIPNSSFQAVSPQPLLLSNEIVQQEGFLHKSTALAVGDNLIAAYSTNGLSLLRFTDGQYTTLKNYTFAELEVDSGSAVRFNSDASVLFIQNNREIQAFSVAADGSLNKLARRQIDSSFVNSYGSEGNSYIGSVFRYPDYNFVLTTFNTSTNSFISKELFRRPDNLSFVVYDETKNLLISGGYSYTTYRYEIKSYKGDALNQFSLISTFELPSGFPDQNNIAYSGSSGNLFIANGSITQLHVQADGVLQEITNTSGFNLPNYSPSKISLSADTLFAAYSNEIHALTLNGTAITGSESIYTQNLVNMAQLNGRLLTIENGGIHYFNQGLNAPQISLNRGEQSLAWLQHDLTLGSQIQFADRYLLRSDSNLSDLYKADTNGKLSNIKTFFSDEILPANGNGSGTIAKLNETSLVAARGNLVRLFNFDPVAETVTLVKEFDLNRLVSDVNRIGYSSGIRMLGSYLLVDGGGRLHLFQIADSTLSYLDSAVAGVNDFTAIPELNNSAELNGKLYIYNSGYNAIHELSVENGRLKQKEVFDMPSSGWGAVQITAAGQQLHVKYGATLYVFQQIDSKFTLLSVNNINENALAYIDNNFALNQYNSEVIDVLQFDKTSGIPTTIDGIDVGDSWNLRNAFMLGSYLYLQSSDNVVAFKQFMVNRAPDLLAKPAVMQLHEGIGYTTELASLVADKDIGDTVMFSLFTPVSGMSLSDKGTFSYDGSTLSANEVIVRATDSKGLYTDISLSFQNNKAPAPTQAWVVPQLNQNKTFLLDLNEYFADPEGSVLTYEITSTAELTVTSRGIISGTITAGQSHQLTVVIKDNKGATSTHTLALAVNAAPALTGSASLSMTTVQTVSVDLNSLFTDAEGHAISFSASDLPAGLTLSGSTIAGKVTTAGSFSSLITATDSAGAVSQTTLKFEATEPPPPPPVVQPKGSSGSLGWYVLFALAALTFSRRTRQV